MQGIGHRLKKIRKELNLTQQNFAEKLELKQNYISKYEKESNEIKIKTLYKILNEFQVNINWLLTGEGEMFVDKGDINKNQNLNNSSEVDEDEFTKQIIEDLKTLDKNAKKKIYLEILTKLEKNEII